MKWIRAIGCLAVIGPVVLSGAALADEGTEEEIVALRAQVDALQAEVSSLHGTQGDNWLTEQRAEEIRGLVQDVLADADTRASLLLSGMSAGYDGGFVIESSDGEFKLKLNGQLQVRFVYNSIDDPGQDNDRWGFENRRTKLKIGGNVGEWKYFFNGAFDRGDGTFGLEDAYIAHALGEGWTMTFGQIKAPFLREELTSSSRQLAVDRSLVNEEFNQDRSQGVQFAYKGDTLQFKAMYGDGFKTKSTGWEDYDTEYAFTARVEYLASGSWKQFKDFTSPMGSETGFMIGAAAGYYQVAEYGSTAGPELERFTWTVDGSLEMDGLNLFGAFIGNNLDDDTPGGDQDQYGVVVQGGYYLDDSTELYARYEWGDEDASTSVDDLSVITVGLNKYYSKKVKATIDLGYGVNEVTSTWASNGVGWRTDTADDDGQLVVRAQLQLVF